MQLKIGDFGLATKLEFEGDRKRTICGTPNYIAPEILDGKQGHSYEVDVWSFGVIMYTLLIGKPPFEASDIKATYRRIRANAYSFPDRVVISNNAKDLITKILNLDPAKRLTISEIHDHSFFHNGNSIPKLLPASTLACPPSNSYAKQFYGSKPKVEVYTLEKPKEESNSLFKSVTNRVRSSEKKMKMKEEKAGGRKSVAELVWVRKWVDFSSKYGLGYFLSNGTFGVFFNDSTKIILDINGKFNYIERRYKDKQEIVFSHTLQDYPKGLNKKVTLLQHFKNYLEGKHKKFEDAAGTKVETKDYSDGIIDKSITPTVYVKKWLRTRHAIMFRLSNKIVQVNFQDHTEVVLNSQFHEVIYVNKKGERLICPLTAALESTNPEMSKRLKYTKDILTYMLSTNQHHEGKNSMR